MLILRRVPVVIRPRRLARYRGQPACAYHPAMPEKADDAWDVSLASLQDHRKAATIGANCNGVTRHRAIEELQRERGPNETVN